MRAGFKVQPWRPQVGLTKDACGQRRVGSQEVQRGQQEGLHGIP